MVKNHLKRLSAPKMWPILRKEETFITRPKPGRGFTQAIALNQVMKNLVKKGATSKEVRYILNHEQVLVNGKQVFAPRLPVGLMDVVSFPTIKEHYMISLTKQGKLTAVPIDEKQAKTRLTKITNKTRHAGKIQVNCNDGTNILLDKNNYQTGDTLVVDGAKVAKHIPLEKGASILLTGGRHLAKIGTVDEIDGRTIIFTADGEQHSTAKKYAFVVGKGSPEVTLR